NRLWRQSRAFFSARGFQPARIDNVVNQVGDTLFIVAGIQIFGNFIHNSEPADPGPYLLGQPSIRLKYLDQVGGSEGISTSFVNLCTEHLDGTFADYQAALDAWLEYFAAIGISPKDIALVFEPAPWKPGL